MKGLLSLRWGLTLSAITAPQFALAFPATSNPITNIALNRGRTSLPLDQPLKITNRVPITDVKVVFQNPYPSGPWLPEQGRNESAFTRLLEKVRTEYADTSAPTDMVLNLYE